jgi:hypothetical protein
MKPSPKKTAPRKTFSRAAFLSPLESVSIDSPEINERYPGRRGRTHGDKKESSPASSAVYIDILFIYNFYKFFIDKAMLFLHYIYMNN